MSPTVVSAGDAEKSRLDPANLLKRASLFCVSTGRIWRDRLVFPGVGLLHCSCGSEQLLRPSRARSVPCFTSLNLPFCGRTEHWTAACSAFRLRRTARKGVRACRVIIIIFIFPSFARGWPATRKVDLLLRLRIVFWFAVIAGGSVFDTGTIRRHATGSGSTSVIFSILNHHRSVRWPFVGGGGVWFSLCVSFGGCMLIPSTVSLQNGLLTCVSLGPCFSCLPGPSTARRCGQSGRLPPCFRVAGRQALSPRRKGHLLGDYGTLRRKASLDLCFT